MDYTKQDDLFYDNYNRNELPKELLETRPSKDSIRNIATLEEFYRNLEKYCDHLEKVVLQLNKIINEDSKDKGEKATLPAAEIKCVAHPERPAKYISTSGYYYCSACADYIFAEYGAHKLKAIT